MNKDQVKGAREDRSRARRRRKAGKLTKNRKQQVKGAAKQAAGKVQKSDGDARDDLDRDEEKDHRSGLGRPHFENSRRMRLFFWVSPVRRRVRHSTRPAASLSRESSRRYRSRGSPRRADRQPFFAFTRRSA